MRREDARRVVEAGYDRIAERYLAGKDPGDPAYRAALEPTATRLEPGATVLDLGCGAGIPASRWLAERGFAVTGVDVSARQIELARANVPGAAFIKADMADPTALDFPRGTFAAAVSFYALIHVPRDEQAALLARVHGWLRPGGLFVATWPFGAWEGCDDNWEGWGAPMWWSHYGPTKNTAMLLDAGFTVESTERVTRGDENWLWVRAQAALAPPLLAPI
jgi:SAM-dependent methyltransferase